MLFHNCILAPITLCFLPLTDAGLEHGASKSARTRTQWPPTTGSHSIAPRHQRNFEFVRIHKPTV